MNKKTGQTYIGKSINIEDRFKQHTSTELVDVAIANEGVDNFVFFIIEESNDNLNELEQYYIKQYNTFEDSRHYNQTAGHGNKGLCGSLHPLSKYTLWDTQFANYVKGNMFREGREPNPCKCFRLVYKGYRVNAIYCEDFLSCEIIGKLIDNFIND